MPPAKRVRNKKQDVATQEVQLPAAIPEGTSVQALQSADVNVEPIVELNQQGEDAVSDTQTTTPTSHDATADTAAYSAAADAAIKKLKADIVITRHVAVAAGAGFIPLPVVDFAAVTAVQLTMLALICDIYDQHFSKEAAKSIIVSLAGGALTGGEASSLAVASRIKFIPIIGTVVSWFVTPAVAGLTTYAIGKVFVHHLETGGSIFTFEAKKMKEYMEKALDEGKKLVPHWGTPAAQAAPAPAASPSH